MRWIFNNFFSIKFNLICIALLNIIIFIYFTIKPIAGQLTIVDVLSFVFVFVLYFFFNSTIILLNFHPNIKPTFHYTQVLPCALLSSYIYAASNKITQKMTKYFVVDAQVINNSILLMSIFHINEHNFT